MQGNRKGLARQPLNYPAKIIADDQSLEHQCRLVDISAGGATLVTETPFDLPATFTLAVSGKIARRCQLRWNEGCEIGVLFLR
jgi:hypothetical protein